MNNVSTASLLSSVSMTTLIMVIVGAIGGVFLIVATMVRMRRRWTRLRDSRDALAAGIRESTATTPKLTSPRGAGEGAGNTSADAVAHGGANAPNGTRTPTLAHLLRALRQDFRACADRVDARLGARRMRNGVPCVLVLNAARDASPVPLSNLDATPWSPISASRALYSKERFWPSRLMSSLQRRLASHHWTGANTEAADTPAIPGMHWTCADKGIVIELRHPLMDYLPASSVPGQPQPVWDAFLRCCRRYRPTRPLDAIVLVVPARLLRDDSVQGHLALKEAGQLAHQRLWHLQRLFAMRIAVYVVIGECETIPGFRALANGFSVTARHSMLGWSSPYSPDRIWEPEWVDEAMTPVLDSIDAATTRHFATSRIDPGEDGHGHGSEGGNEHGNGIDATASAWVGLSGEWAAMRQPLHRYIEALMRPNAYHDPFLLRGIYWGGDAAASAPGAPPHETHSAPAFYRDLLLRKAFAEIGLTRASSTQYWRAYNGRRIAAWGAAAFFASWTVGLGLASMQTAARAKVLAATLRDLRQDESAMSSTASHAQDGMPTGGYRSKLIALLAVDATLVGPLARLTMPGTWLPFDRLEWQASARFQQRFGDVAVVALDRAFRQRVQQLTAAPLDAPGRALTPRDLPAMRAVRSYADNVDALVQALRAWERLQGGQDASADDLRTVFRYGMQLEVPSDAADRLRHFYRHVKGAPSVSTVTDPALRHAVQQGWQRRATQAQRDVLSASPLLVADKRVDALIGALGQGALQDGTPTDWPERYGAVVSLLDDEAGMVASGAWRWILSDTEGPPRQPMPEEEAASVGVNSAAAIRDREAASSTVSVPTLWPIADDVETIALRVSENALLGPAIARDWRRDWQRARRVLHADMTQWLSNPGSGLTWHSRDATWHLKPARIALRGALTSLLAQPFMTPARTQAMPAPAAGQVLLWRLDGLMGAATLDEARQQYLGKTLLALAPDVAQTIRHGVDTQRASLLLHRLGESAQRVPISMMRGPIDEAAASSATPVRVALARIADTLAGLGAQAEALQLQTRLSADAMSWLGDLDQRLQASALYAVDRATADQDGCRRSVATDRSGPGASASWPIACAFGIRTQQGLASFVGAQSVNLVTWGEQAKALLPLLTAADANSDVARKWRGIVLDLARYAVRSPASSLLQLEQYILAAGRSGNSQASSVDACARIAGAPPEVLPQDFFGQTQWQLYRWLAEQCGMAGVTQRRAAWQAFQAVFNAQLAGRAPFAAPSWRHAAWQPPAADPAQIAKALVLFERFAAQTALTDIDSDAFGFADTPASVTTFARQFAATVKVLGASTRTAALTAVPRDRAAVDADAAALGYASLPLRRASNGQNGLRVRATFRVNQALESYGNQIIDWTLQSGSQRVSKPRDALPDKEPLALAWQPGEPIVLTLRLADEARIRVRADPRQPAMATDGKTVTFRFDDVWALLTMIDRHRVSTGADTQMLAFSFPVTPCMPDDAQGCRAPISEDVLGQVRALEADPRSGMADTLNARVFIHLALQSDSRPMRDAGPDAMKASGAVTAVGPIDWPMQRPQGAPSW